LRLPDDLALKDSTLKDQYFDLRGLSAYSSLSVSTLRDHIKSDDMRCYLVKGKILVRKSDFDTWLQRFRVNRSMDVDRITNEVLHEIGLGNRRSANATH